MEDGVKEEPAKPKEVKCAGKAGWLKKSSGKFLSSYKDRYIQLDRTEIAIYENEELTTCLEKLDLDNYEHCHELKSAFKRKHRLVLIRNPKSGNKVQDVKLQAQTPEEKDAWIKALSEGINKAKNKVFDEVKVDESCSLEHVTRSRPRGNRGRRPPTRIHMKETANSSSDGVLRLDLDGEVTVLNGTRELNKEGDKETETLQTLNDISEEDADEDSTPQKNVIKPPMPPSKDNKPNDSHKEEEDPTPPKKILTPPMPPSKENKPSVVASEGNVETEANLSEPTPSNKGVQPPAPPSKHTKPNQPVTTENQEIQEKLEEVDSEDEMDSRKKNEKEDQPFTLPNKIIKPQVVMWDSPITTSKESSAEQEEKDSQKDTSDTTEEVITLKEPQLATVEHIKKSPGPPAPPKKKPVKPTVKTDETSPQSNPTVLTISTTPSSEKLSEPSSDKGDVRPTTPKIEPGGYMSSEDLEEKSLDSGQHSGEESEIGDQVTASTAKLKGSSQGLDLETSEDDLDPSDGKAERLEEPSLEKPTTAPESSVLNTCPTSNQCANKPLLLTLPLKHSSKVRSASLGDLLFQNTDNMEGAEKEIKPHGSNVEDLQSKVSFEIAETEELLSVITTGHGGEMEVEGRASPEILLNAAMEKLRKADQFLKEARGFKDLNKNNRLSL